VKSTCKQCLVSANIVERPVRWTLPVRTRNGIVIRCEDSQRRVYACNRGGRWLQRRQIIREWEWENPIHMQGLPTNLSVGEVMRTDRISSKADLQTASINNTQVHDWPERHILPQSSAAASIGPGHAMSLEQPIVEICGLLRTRTRSRISTSD